MQSVLSDSFGSRSLRLAVAVCVSWCGISLATAAEPVVEGPALSAPTDVSPQSAPPAKQPKAKSETKPASPPAPAKSAAQRHVVNRPVLSGSMPLQAGPSHDQVWLVSSRSTSCGSSNIRLRYWLLVGGRWQPSSLEHFLASDHPAIPTTFFVHGNRFTSGEAASSGISVYRQIAKCSGHQPIRFVIWSWPSDPTRGILRDARIKAQRANSEGFLLGWFIDQIQPDVKITLLGYSYGARVVTGGLHALGGGAVTGRRLQHRHNPVRTPINVVLMAAGLDQDWLVPGRTHGRALSQVNCLLLLNNPCDRVLRSYRFLAPYRPQALGYTGLPQYSALAPYRHKIVQVNICHRQHDWRTYVYSSQTLSRIQKYATWQTGFSEFIARSAAERRTSPPARRTVAKPVL